MIEPFDTAPRNGRLFWAWQQYELRWQLMQNWLGTWYRAEVNIGEWCATSAILYTHWAPLDPPAAP